MSHPVISGYTFDACCGSGAFGSVWRARWSGEFECAVKVLTPGTWHPQYLSWCLERLRREGERSGIVRIYSYDLGGESPHITMAMMPVGSVTLEQLGGRLPLHEAWSLLDQVAGTVAWLHSEGMVHTGLSGGNVFVCPGPAGEPVVVVSDVGQGWLTGAPLARLHGQIACIAPEQWREAMALLQEGRARLRDVYAFGVMAWRLLTGGWPRGAKVFDAIAASHSEDLKLDTESFAAWLEKQQEPVWPSEAASPEEAARREVVQRCLAFDPAVRFHDMAEVQAALKELAIPKPAAGAAPAIAVEMEPEPAAEQTSLDAATEPEGGTEEAFSPEHEAPRKRRFALRLPKLSLRLQKERYEARPWWRLLFGPGTAAVSLLTVLGVTAWALKEYSARRMVTAERRDLQREVDELKSKLPRLEADLSNARSEAAAARAEQAAAARHRSVELISGLLAVKPVEDHLLEGWRMALKGVAGHCAKALENAPPDAGGMEARWQLASLHHALGDSSAALPVLESLARDLEAAAIAAARDFPAEQVRLTGRVEALTGSILHSQGRLEDALPHLRKACDSLEKWATANPDDTATVRLYANSLLLEGLALEERAQYDQAKESLMRISGLITLPSDDVNAMAEERFIDSDAKVALSRLKKMEAAGAKPEDLEGVLNDAFKLQYEAQELLLAYYKANPKSVPGRSRLARSYFEMARTLSRLHAVSPGNQYAKDARTAFSESVGVYSELMKELPEGNTYILELAGVYSEAAQLMRAATPGKEGLTEAMEYQGYAVSYLEMLNQNTPLDNTVRRHLAAALVANGEMHQDAGEPANAIETQNKALSLLNDLLAESTLTDKDRRLCRRVSARAWTALASIYERTGKRTESIAALTKAYADWEFSPVDDPSDQKKMAWVKETLDKLKPR